MKKIIPFLTLIGASALIVGCGSTTQTNQSVDYAENISSFKTNLDNYTILNEHNLSNEKLNKYKMLFSSPSDATLVNGNTENELIDVDDTINSETFNNQEITENQEENENDFTEENIENNDVIEENIEDIKNDKEKTDANTIASENTQISTLYSLSNDIENSCDDFCMLKENITNAILETQNLINKVKANEIQLTSEEKMFITEQSQQLKSLGKQLSRITTELSINLSDINTLKSGQSLDELNMKYLVVLDNLVNGNEMLENGLYTLNMINNLFNSNMLGNNNGRIIRYKKSPNTPPIIEDYSIDENGNVVNNLENMETNNENADESVTKTESSSKNIDTYKNNKLESNIDSYYTNTPRNIDSFFNTALMDNEFMYGNGGYGWNMPMMNGYGMNGYMNNPYYNNNYNTTYGVNNNVNTPQNEETQKIKKRKNKKIELNKNIDTYKDEKTPDLKTRYNNIKNSISGFFSKLKRPNKNNKIKNPIYRYEE